MSNKAIIFDLNGVFIKSPLLSERIEQEFKIPKETFVPALSAVMTVVRLPNAPSLYKTFKPHFDAWKLKFTETEFLDFWFSVEYKNEAMVKYAQTLKEEGWKIFVLSNNFKERVKYYSESVKFDFLKEFDHLYYSCETGFVKPDKRCYTQILKDNNLNPNDCYYFDDSEKNILSAKELGINAHKFTGIYSTYKILKEKN